MDVSAESLRGLGGMVVLLVLAWSLGEDRRHPPWRIVLAGVGLQFALALVLTRSTLARAALARLNAGADALQKATDAGTSVVFGYLGGAPLPFVEAHPGGSFILAFRAFPLVLVISALAAILLHWGVLQRIVGALAWGLRHTLGIGGALGLGAAVHIFVGMIEAPLLVRPYLRTMSRGDLLALMSCGLAGIAGTVMVIYAGLLNAVIPNALGNILVAATISTPAALALAALMVPIAVPEAAAGAVLSLDDPPGSTLEALIRGTNDGIGFIAAIIATLIVLLAIVGLINGALSLVPSGSDTPITLQAVFALVFRPIMWLIGVPWAETVQAAALMGTKTVLNEFVAYLDLSKLPPEALSARTRLVMTYALCGFANFGSLGIMIGGMTAMAPERRPDIVALAPRALLAGTLATCMSGAVIGIIS